MSTPTISTIGTPYTIEVVGTGRPWFNQQYAIPAYDHLTTIGSDSFGVTMLDEGPCGFTLRMEAGIESDSKGGFDFDKIILRGPSFMSIIPRVNHAIGYGDGGFAIYIGNGGETFPPRAIKICRFVIVPFWKRVISAISLGTYQLWRAIFARPERTASHAHLALPKALLHARAKYDAIGERILTALRTGKADPSVGLHSPALGCWMPMGYQDKGEVGGGGIEPYPAFERSPLYRILSHDLTMEREAVSNCTLDGKPKTDPREGYNSTSGPTIYTTLPEFSVKQPDGYYTRPKMLNSRSCSYREALLAYDKRDDEHAVRSTAHAKAAAFLFGDKAAALDLEAKAADLWIGTHMPKRPGDEGKGSDAVGRGLAWTLNALQACAAEWTGAPCREIVEELLRVQDTETGSYQAFKPDVNYYHSPSPYDLSAEGLPSMPREYRAAHTLEVAYLAMGVAHHGMPRSADKATKFLSAQMPRQWVAVTQGQFLTYGNLESFSCWGVWGLLAQRDQTWASRMEWFVPPGAPGICGANVVQALVDAGYWEASAKAIESAER